MRIDLINNPNENLDHNKLAAEFESPKPLQLKRDETTQGSLKVL